MDLSKIEPGDTVTCRSTKFGPTRHSRRPFAGVIKEIHRYESGGGFITVETDQPYFGARLWSVSFGNIITHTPAATVV